MLLPFFRLSKRLTGLFEPVVGHQKTQETLYEERKIYDGTPVYSSINSICTTKIGYVTLLYTMTNALRAFNLSRKTTGQALRNA